MKTKLFFTLIALYFTVSTANSQTPAIEKSWAVDSAQITQTINEIRKKQVYEIKGDFDSLSK